MREILFRGKTLDGRWVEGSYGHSTIIGEDTYVATIIYSNDTNLFVADWDEVVPETVGQFIGMYDKNGKKIFEGDIIRTVTFGFDCDKFITEVKFGARSGVQGFYLANGRSMFYFGQKNKNVMDDTEVIGNIHDNPELIENN